MSVAGVRATGGAGWTPVNSEILFVQGAVGDSVHAGTAKETLPGRWGVNMETGEGVEIFAHPYSLLLWRDRKQEQRWGCEQ